jgi:hypothetical protein
VHSEEIRERFHQPTEIIVVRTHITNHITLLEGDAQLLVRRAINGDCNSIQKWAPRNAYMIESDIVSGDGITLSLLGAGREHRVTLALGTHGKHDELRVTEVRKRCLRCRN